MGTTLDGAAAPEGGGFRPSAAAELVAQRALQFGEVEAEAALLQSVGEGTLAGQKHLVSHAARSVAQDERRRGQHGRAAQHAAERLA